MKEATSQKMRDVPLVTNEAGHVPTKAQTSEQVQLWAKHLRAKSGHYTGHSLRTTGAQRLAMAGVSESKIIRLGRWASKAMLRYVRDSLLAKSETWVARQVEDSEHVKQEPAKSSSSSGKHTRAWKSLRGPCVV